VSDSRQMIPTVSVKYAHDGRSAASDALGMRPMQARVWLYRGERYLLIKSPPASGKSRALMFVALDKLRNQGSEAGDHHRAGKNDRRQLPR
jgi:hypothetical protein